MTFLIYTLHVLICFFLIAVVLLQQGKGADLSVFGGGGTQTAFGARGAATVLHKLTVGSFIFFIITTMAIGVLQTNNEGSEVLGGLPEAPSAEATAEDTDEEAEAEAEQGALPADTTEQAGEPAASEAGEPAEATTGDSPDAEAGEAVEEPGAEDASTPESEG